MNTEVVVNRKEIRKNIPSQEVVRIDFGKIHSLISHDYSFQMIGGKLAQLWTILFSDNLKFRMKYRACSNIYIITCIFMQFSIKYFPAISFIT